MNTLRAKSFLGAVAVAALLPAVLAGSAAAAPGSIPYLWEVPGASAATLTAAGFDVDHGLVVGDDVVADRVRSLGYRVVRVDTVYKPLSPTSNRAEVQTFYGGYHTVAEHEKHVSDVAAAYPALTQVFDIGDSWRKTKGTGGHDIRAICITKKQAGDCALKPNSPKPRMAMMAQIHARELSTGELAWRWMDYLTKGYGSDAEVTSLLNSTELWVVPIVNPDGVDIVASGGNQPLMQRKNADNTGASCGTPSYGIDLNRNSTFKWGGAGTGRCDETYQGPSAGSEPETKAMEAFFRSLFPDQRGPGDTEPAPVTTTGVMLTLHSYGNEIMPPWGWTWDPNPNAAGLKALGDRMAVSNGYRVIAEGDTTGTTDDFTYGNLGVANYTVEVGGSSGSCGGFFPQYSCLDSLFWPKNKGAFVTAAKAAKAPYAG